MSKNIVIQEGGIGKQITADKLKTNLSGGGTCLWVLEEDVQLGTKMITENGIYYASEDGLYGYSRVTINVAGGEGSDTPGGPGSSITGKNGDGEDVVVSVDENGDIQTQIVPSSIRVLTPPYNQYGIWMNGQTITKDGMVVKAYLHSGAEWGVVSNSAITLDPTTATYNPATDYGVRKKATSDVATALTQPIVYGNEALYKRYRTTYRYQGSAIAGYIPPENPDRMYLIFASSSPQVYVYDEIWNDGSEGHNRRTHNGTAYTRDGKTVYYARLNTSNASDIIWTVALNTLSGEGTYEDAAWTMIYGNIETEQAGSHQTITASWKSPSGRVLKANFNILVAPPIYGNSNN